MNQLKLKIFVISLLVLSVMACNNKGKTAMESSGENKAVEAIPVEIPEGTFSELVVDLSDTGIKIQPTMYGVFFEDINFGADGGIYAELIKNKSFEFPDAKMGWLQPNSVKYSLNEESGFAKITDYSNPKGGNKKYSHTVVHNDAKYELINEGFRGIGLKKDAKYNLSVMLANAEGIENINFALVDTMGNVFAKAAIKPNSGDWKKYETVLIPNKTEAKAQLKITFTGKGSVDMDLISLFPQDTWKGRKNGLRKDIVELLEGLNPGFVRFPGGCIVEGRDLAKRYQWQKTVGAPEERELMINRWNVEFAHKPAPDYYQSFGLGFFEYFQLSEDLGAEPIPILGCGMACQFNTGELVPLDKLDPYVQEALDLVEFANGDTSTPWGKVRADMGHPEPFNMKYLGIGNEQWGPEYFERFEIFFEKLKEEYPEIIIVSTPGPFPDGDMFEYGWEQMRRLNVALADEHYYRRPDWFRKNADRYDSYDRKGPKVFAGEYAAHPVNVEDGPEENNWEAALAEAAFMTGLERNADVVLMTAYAPLLANIDAFQWAPDLIWFNNLEAHGSVNYQVQKLYANNPGTAVLQLTENGKPIIGEHALYASAVKDANSGELIVKVVNTANGSQSFSLTPESGSLVSNGTITTLQSDDLRAINSLENPDTILPETTDFTIEDSKAVFELKPQSVNMIKIKFKE